MMKDFRIDIGDTVNINGVNVHRVNNIYYNVNNDLTKVKKTFVLGLINEPSLAKEEGIDWSEVAKLCKRLNLGIIEEIEEGIHYNEKQNVVLVSGEQFGLHTEDLECDEEGFLLKPLDEKLSAKFANLLDELVVRGGYRQSFDGYVTWNKSPHLIIYDTSDATIDRVVEYFFNDFDCSISEEYINLYDRPKTSELSAIQKQIEKWFKSADNDSVMNYWNTNKDRILDEMWDNVDGQDDIIEAIREWINSNEQKYKKIINDIIVSEIDFKAKRKKEQKEYEEQWKRYYRNTQTNNYWTEQFDPDYMTVEELCKGRTYKEVAKLLHPDVSKYENATQLFQILQKYKHHFFK